MHKPYVSIDIKDMVDKKDQHENGALGSGEIKTLTVTKLHEK